MKEAKIKVLALLPMELPKEIELNNTLEAMQNFVGGLILHEYQSFPKLNEVVKIGRFEFRIIKNTMTKIEVVKLKVNA